jgi:hypothetical protein
MGDRRQRFQQALGSWRVVEKAPPGAASSAICPCLGRLRVAKRDLGF